MGCFEFDPGFCTAGFFTGKFGSTETVFNSFQGNLNFVAYSNFQFTFLVVKLISGDDAFRLQTSMYRYPVFIYIDNYASNDGAGVHFNGL